MSTETNFPKIENAGIAVYNNNAEAIGNTPLVRINRLIQSQATVLAKIESVKNVIATDYSGVTPATQLNINEIGEVNIKLSKALYFDTYNDNKSNGAFILIDAATNTTAGVGFVR